MRVVIDTNILLPCLSQRSSMHWLFKEILNEKLTLCVTTDILNEYAEIFERKLGSKTAVAFLDLITTLPNLVLIDKYYFWQAIDVDPDDNKFVDCAVSARAQFLITDDTDFNGLRRKPLFEVEIVRFSEFTSKYTP